MIWHAHIVFAELVKLEFYSSYGLCFFREELEVWLYGDQAAQ